MRHSIYTQKNKRHGVTQMFNLNVPESEEIINRVKEIIEKADASEFNKRDKGLKLNIFLEAFTVSLCSMQTITLEGIANKCEELQEEMQKYGFSMSKQSLFRRLEQGSKELKKVLENVINLDIEKMVSKPQIAMVLEQFRSVDITDSTTITLPDKLEEFHKGLGGKNAKSAMKIQATYNIKGKDFKKISIIEDATTSDGSYVTELIKEMQMNDLSICDLGYYGIEGFQGIAEKGAYFISKIKTNTNVY